MAIKSVACVWSPVTDWAATKAFWLEKVGLETHGQGYEGEWQELTVRGDTTVLAMHPFTEQFPPGMNAIVTFDTDDIEADVARMKAAGVEFVGDIHEEPGIVKLATFKDPSGNTFQLGQSLM